MIYGIGTDMVEIARMQGLLQRWGDKAGRRILAESEGPLSGQTFCGKGSPVQGGWHRGGRAGAAYRHRGQS